MENSHLVKEAARRHPLDPLSAEEVAAAVRTLRTQCPASDHLRFVSVNLHEPAKSELESISTGNTLDRRAFIVVIDLAARRMLEALVSLCDETLLSCEERHGVQPGIIVEEFILCEKAVKADPRWRAALSRRGIIEFDKAIVDPWSAAPTAMNIFPTAGLPRALPGFVAAMPT